MSITSSAGHDGCKGLTDTGREQSVALAARFARSNEFRPDVVIASSLPRAVETAELATAGLGWPAVQTLDSVIEQHVGESDGLTLTEYEARYGRIDNPDPDRLMAPSGESPKMFDARVAGAMDALVDEYRDQTIMVFTHGGVVTAATLYLLGAPGHHTTGTNWRPPRNTSLNVVFSSPPGERWALDRYNDAAHLD
ncbi:MAG TPA: histidine phosphatase family protein [Acidimicrobiia bacterium]|nr:histidine phosphatase family protein [Acidimicrobiia bacterium]